MPTQPIQDADVTPPSQPGAPPGPDAWRKVKVSMMGFDPDEVTEIRRGLLHRMTVAQANRNDPNIAPEQRARWQSIYVTDWSAFRKVTQATGTSPTGRIKHDGEAPSPAKGDS